MGQFNEELVKAGVMLAGDGLRASAQGVRIHYAGDKRSVVDGPFTEAKELIAGYWIWQVKSMDEAVEWAKRIPFHDGEVELRRVFRGGGLWRRVHARTAGRQSARKMRLRATIGGRQQ